MIIILKEKPLDKLSFSIKKTSYQVLLYSAGNMLLKFIGLLLLPLYTSVFKVADYGVIGVLETSSLILSGILSLNLSSALVRWLTDSNLESKTVQKQREKSVIFTIFSMTLIVLTGFSLLVFPFIKVISSFLFKSYLNLNVSFSYLLILMLIGVYIDILNRIPLNLIRIREKPVLYSLSMLLRVIVTFGLNILLIKHYKMGIEAVFWGNIAGNVIFFVCSIPLIMKNIRINFLWDEVRDILKYSIPLVFVGFGGILLSLGDRYVLSYIKDLGQVGIYTLAYKVSSIVNLLVLQAFNLAVLPIAFKSFNSEAGKVFIARIMFYLSLLLCFLFLVVSVFSFDVLKIFSKSSEYLAAVNIIPVLLFAYIFDGMRIVFSYHILYVKKTIWNAYLTFTGAIVNIGLNILIIPKYGYMGAAITTVVSSILLFIMYYQVGQKNIYIKYPLNKVGLCLCLTMMFFFIDTLINLLGIKTFLSSILLVFLYIISLFIFRFIRFNELKKLI